MSAHAGKPPVLELEGVTIAYTTRRGEVEAVKDVSFKLMPGESMGLVGESGSGKSTVAFAVMRYLARNGRVSKGRILLEGRDVASMDEASLRKLRGARMAMVYQEPMSSLNPVIPIERQLMEVLQLHGGVDDATARARAIEMLTTVRLPDPERMAKRYPHELSGGQQQRVVIAMALMANPSLLVLDEPTTALDVRVQAEILQLVAELRQRFGAAILYISHDLGTVATLCDRVGVLFRGQLVEQGPCEQVFTEPQHPYTQRLVGSVPKIDGPVPPTNTEQAEPLVAVRGLFKSYAARPGIAGMKTNAPPVRAVNGVDIAIGRGRTLALVGESGCGKSTIAKILLGLERPDGGQVELSGGFDLGGQLVTQRPAEVLSRLQMVFQNPDATLNPSHSIGYAIGRPLQRLGKARGDVDTEVQRLLEAVRLPPSFAKRYPHQLSGGQKQRVAIARALASSPDIVIADEPTSSLDVSIQARVVELLRELKRDRQLTLVFISHDLALVRQIADDVAVLYRGEVVEYGPVDEVFRPPHHPYTEELLAAVPRLPRRNGPALTAA